MATIDPSIAMGYKPVQIENPLNQMAAYSQLQGAQQGQQMNALKMRQAQQEFDTQNRLGKAWQGSINPDTGEVDYNRLVKNLSQDELGATAIPGVIEAQKKAALATQQLKSQQATEQKTIADTKTAALKNIREKTSDLQFNPSDDNIRAHAQDAVLHGVWTQAQADQNVATATALPMAQRPSYFARQGLDAEKRVTTEETARHNIQTEKTAGRQADISSAHLTLAQNKATRDLTMGAIPAGHRYDPETKTLIPIEGGPTTTPLAPKEKQKREAIYPKATSAIKAFEDTSNDLIKDLAELRNHPGLSSITGIAAGRLPGVTKEGRAAQALYDKIVARGGFQALTDLRAAGGTLGAVSNQEGTQLKDSYAAINRTQDAADVRKALDQALANTQRSKERVREEYDTTYEYRNTVPRSSATPAGAKPSLNDIFNPQPR
jgi:hypothetical protein